jgi:hypothetical protein
MAIAVGRRFVAEMMKLMNGLEKKQCAAMVGQNICESIKPIEMGRISR